ncbi:hypothetical protein F5984_12570 [Rudanella paleaurantiibacter]|uniref:Uncharacterized protein n=1 Tax=Rudanella paleaurantiibacter TaxID=2614655 RepID=A0A7J5TXZ7_9BACT|nr:hypothetical protein [Rudanella paleaurantiibacter]KAB7730013.1 hypothetical protein F5984_12570 [Rudanella paleaurantiibacter]
MTKTKTLACIIKPYFGVFCDLLWAYDKGEFNLSPDFKWIWTVEPVEQDQRGYGVYLGWGFWGISLLYLRRKPNGGLMPMP